MKSFLIETNEVAAKIMDEAKKKKPTPKKPRDVDISLDSTVSSGGIRESDKASDQKVPINEMHDSVRDDLEQIADGVESEGKNDLRGDFDGDMSVWFRDYTPHEKTAEGTAPRRWKSKLDAMCKKHGFENMIEYR